MAAETTACSCKHFDERSASMNKSKFLDKLRDQQLLKEGSFTSKFQDINIQRTVDAVGRSVETEGIEFDSRWCHSRTPSGRIMALGSTQPLREKSIRNIFCGSKGGRCLRLTVLPP